MDTRIASSAHPDLVMIESMPRPTPTPTRVSFSQVLSAGVSGVVQGAEAIASKLPGGPMAAAAIRGGMSAMSAPIAAAGGGIGLNTTPEGPGGVGSAAVGIGATGIGVGGTSADASGSIDASLQQSAQLNLYYLQVQQEVDAQNRSFTALSNVLKTEHDSAKSAIGNIHS